MQDNLLAERRRQRRYRLSSKISIVDQLQEHTIGQLVNIHQEGLLLLGTPLPVHSAHSISLLLPNTINQHTHVKLGIECLWNQPTNQDESSYWCGCSIIDKSPVASACIQSLINIQTHN